MPSLQIKVEWSQSDQVVGIFKNQQDTVRQTMNKLKSAKDELDSGKKWVGKGAKAFYREFDERLLPAFDALAKAMEGGAMNLTKAQETMHKAEDESKNIFAKIFELSVNW